VEFRFEVSRVEAVSIEHKHAICLCVDARMLIPALFVADGVRKAALAREQTFDLIVFVPAEDVDGSHREWAARRGITLRHDIDVSSVRDIVIRQSRLSTATLMKLLLPQHLAGEYEKILYLDADLVVEDDVTSLFGLDMGGFAIAAVPTGRTWAHVTDRERAWWLKHFRELGMTAPYRYFNTGVMLIDVATWNRQELTRRTVEFIRQNPDVCYLPDEDALNAVLDGKLLEVSPIWNTRPAGIQGGGSGDLEPVIVHFIGPVKPWMRFRKNKGLFQHSDAYRRYEDFLRDTSWSAWLGQQWTWRDLWQAVGQTAKKLFSRHTGSASPEAEQQAERRRYYAETAFADVEQGIAVRDGSRLRLAPPPTPR
jgi:lipopolysaccharide biosynthesis glycosyltransferase